MYTEKPVKKEPLFSVIMPNYNNGKYVKEAIESVLAQTYSNWELVIVDDASTDNSLDVIKPFLDNSKIKLITHDVNKGVAHAAKLAVDNSSGEIIGTLDSDDVLDKNALMTMANEHIAHPECGLIYSNYYTCDKNLEITGKLSLFDPLPDNLSLQEILLGKEGGLPISWHFRTFKKSSYDKTDGYDTTLLSYEDRDLYYKLEKVTSIKCIDKCLLYYRDDSEQGAYRGNPKNKYYWFTCEYKETKRRLGINLPFANRNTPPLFLSNLIYFYLRRSSNINKERLRKKFQSFLYGIGCDFIKTNKLLASFYIINSFIYGYEPITLHRIKEFCNLNVSDKQY